MSRLTPFPRYTFYKGITARLMKTRYYFLLYTFPFILLANEASAQTGTCDPGVAEAFLDVGNVRARILNNGALFWNGSPSVYEVPRGSGSNAIFASNIWIAGTINNELRGSVSRYGPRELWPGPLDEQGNPPADCSIYDQLWQVNQQEIFDLLDMGIISENIRNWPWQLGAPVIDGDGNEENYNPEGGDLPELYGHQRIWWIMNDRGNMHEISRTNPLGLEIHASAFAYGFPDLVKNHTFYEYKLINKNTSPITNAYFTYWTDGDLGNFDDDYVGSDSLLHLGYYYNADNDDEGGQGYGIAPPAVGLTFIKTAIADQDGLDNDRDNIIDEPGEMIGTSVAMQHSKSGNLTGDPNQFSDYFNFMQAKWKDGSPLQEGMQLGFSGSGIDWPATLPKKRTRFSFSGDPVNASFWTERNIDRLGTINDPADRRFHISTGPFSIQPGDTLDIAFAVLWARGTDNLDSVTELKKNAESIRAIAETLLSPGLIKNPFADPVEAPPSFVLGFDQNFPNPFSQSTTIRYSLPQSMQVRLAIYDALGREVALLVNQQQAAGIYTSEFDAGSLPTGIYIARIAFDKFQFNKRMILIR